MFTTSRANCETYIQCDEDDHLGINLSADWQICYLGGRQYFTNPHIGDLSITFSKAGGVDGDTEDGLHSPILQLANINNLDPLDVEANANANTGKSEGNLAAGKAEERALSAWAGSAASPGRASTTASVSTATPLFMAPAIRQAGALCMSSSTSSMRMALVRIMISISSFMTPATNPSDRFRSSLLMLRVRLWVSIAICLMCWRLRLRGGDDAVSFAYAGETWLSTDTTHCQRGGGADDGYQYGSRSGNCRFTCNEVNDEVDGGR
ncbi:hypothetical protein OEA41_007757 [Lepraria neglecta]|uniref:Uncharacterized protein n=1 Tax=Lepraria neglecta TaxID=209136 RepID=A0AAD9ZG40_9LECA|nr:hypothetical protein OEA41_007757 [Lepraria neglecta]